jgi:hypothetical protein
VSTDIKKIKSLGAELVQKSKGTLVAPREVLDRISVISPAALQTLEDLMMNSKADSVRLKAALEVLALAGVTKETRLTIRADVSDMDDSEINSRLNDLLSRAAHTAIEGRAKDITPKTH